MADVKPLQKLNGITTGFGATDTVPFANLNLVGSFIGKTIVKSKAADETVTTSTTLQNDDDLVIPIGANEEMDGFLIAQAVFGAGNGKIAFTVPSGCTITMTGTISSAGFASADGTTAKSLTITLTTSSYFTLLITVRNGANAGNIQFQFAQNTSNAAATTFKKDTKFILTRTA